MNARFDISSIVITTPHLVLREWRQADLKDLYEYAKVEGVGQMAGWLPHEDIKKSQVVLKVFISGKKTFAIYHKEDKKVIGSIGIEMYDERLTEFKDYEGREIGYVLSKDYWNRGLMTEAVKAVSDYCFKTLRYDFLLCGHYEFNRQSARVQEKCGFEPYRRLVFDTRFGTKEEGLLEILINPKRTINIEPRHRESLVYKPLVKTAEQMWNEFRDRNSIDKNTRYEAWEFGCDANKLAGLVLKGEKHATTSAFDLYGFEGEKLPESGEYSVVLNKDGFAVCIIRDISVEVKRFCDVDAEFAAAEGEGDKSLKYWREVHTKFLSDELMAETKIRFTENTMVVCESFEVVYR